MLPNLSLQLQALEYATVALSVALMGRGSNDMGLVRESLRLYTRGLGELQRALWNPKLVFTDETLAACIVLGWYELIECPAEATLGIPAIGTGV